MLECVLCEKSKKSKGTSSFLYFKKQRKHIALYLSIIFTQCVLIFVWFPLSGVGLYCGRMKIA